MAADRIIQICNITGLIMRQFSKFGILLLTMLVGACASPYDIKRGAYSDYVAGQHAKYERDTQKAADYYENALKLDPDNEFILQEAFSLALMDGDFKYALKSAEDLQQIGAKNSSASMLLSLNALKKGRLDDAERYLLGAEGSGFDSLVAPIVRAWVLAQKDMVDEAILELEVLKTVPMFEPYQKDQAALILDYADRFDEAEQAYMGILSGQGSVTVHQVIFYGDMLVRSNQKSKAEALYKVYQLQLYNNKRFQDAVGELEDIKPKDIDSPTAVEALAHALLRAASEIAQDNTHAPAILYARLSSFMAPSRDDTFVLLGNLFLAQHQPEAALRALEHVSAGSDFYSLARVREAYAYNQQDNSEKAFELMEAILAEHPDDTVVRVSLGDMYIAHDRHGDALKHYDIAVKSLGQAKPQNWYLLFSRAIAYERLGRWDEAEADFLHALTLNPNEPQVLNYLGYSWVDRGKNFNQARRLIERAVVQRPNDGAIMDSLGWVLYLIGEYGEAAEKLQRAVELLPNDPLINDHLGDAYWMVGREIEARFQWRHALTLEPEEDLIANIEDKIRLGLTIVQALEGSVDATNAQ